MSVKYCILRIMSLSSDQRAVLDFNPVSRRLSVTSLYSKPTQPYRSFGCVFVTCPYPNRTCIECHMNIEHQYLKTKVK